MEIKVLWSDTALSQLEDIYVYCKTKATYNIAKKLVTTIIDSTFILESKPLLGVKEPLLSLRRFEYRFIIVKNYKIIYRFNDNLIRIVAVFDCRQNPRKIEQITD